MLTAAGRRQACTAGDTLMIACMHPQAVPDSHVTVRPVTDAMAARLCDLRVETAQYRYVGDIQAALFDAAGKPQCQAMAVLLGDEVVGFYCIDFACGDAHRAVLRGLRIDRNHQGRGLGRRALAACIDDLRRRHPGVRTLVAHVDHGNRRAIDLYRGAGFREADAWDFGGPLPQQQLELALDAGQPPDDVGK